jgi:hypothetical protein
MNLRLTAALGAGKRRVVLAQVADGGRRQESVPDFFLRQLASAFAKRVHQRRHDAGGSTGRRRHDQMAARVFFRAGQGIRRHHSEAALPLVLVVHRARIDLTRFGLELDRTGECGGRSFQSGLDDVDHRRADLVDEGVDLRFALAGDGDFVRHHDLRDRELVALCVRLQFRHR